MNTTVTKKLQDQLRYYSRKVQRLRVKYLIVNVILVLNLKMKFRNYKTNSELLEENAVLNEELSHDNNNGQWKVH